ncbi:MAG: hypothetical protein U0X93_12595 [Anaerolineales bacterium]
MTNPARWFILLGIAWISSHIGENITVFIFAFFIMIPARHTACGIISP